MARGEITISEERCTGCGFCVLFCSRGCITIDQKKIGSRGVAVAEFVAPEKCNACAVCGWMCASYAIEVYTYVEAGK